MRDIASVTVDAIRTSVGDLRAITVEERPHEENANTDEDKGVDCDTVRVGNNETSNFERGTD